MMMPLASPARVSSSSPVKVDCFIYMVRTTVESLLFW